MPQLVHIFERKTGKQHRCYPVDAVESLKLRENPQDPDSKPLYVATEAECDVPQKVEAPKPQKVEAPKPAKVK